MTDPSALVEAQALSVHFQRGGLLRAHERVHAIDGVSMTIPAGSTLGLAGESGSGKSTLGRALLGLVPITSGVVRFDGAEVASAARQPTREDRRRMQMVFQDPYDSLDPRHSVEQIIGEPLRVTRLGTPDTRRSRVQDLLDLVGLSRSFASRRVAQLSGGQRQRVGIARALASQPPFIVCDEPTSNLDVSVQAQIINLLRRLQAEFALTYLFISHNLAVLRWTSEAVAILYLGRIVETGPTDSVFANPRHPYTAALLSAVPVPEPARARARTRMRLPGDPPSPIALPTGCRFHPRCPRAQDRCRVEDPVLTSENGGGPGTTPHAAACFFPLRSDVDRGMT